MQIEIATSVPVPVGRVVPLAPPRRATRPSTPGHTDVATQIEALRRKVFGRPVPSYPSCPRLAKMLFDMCGPTAETVAEIAHVRRLAWPIDRLALRLRATHAAALGEKSDWAGAVDVSRPLWRRDPIRALSVSSLAVIEKLHLFGVDRSPIGAACAAVMAETRGHAAGLDAVLADVSTSIAVVGNGPTELGRGRGAEIDRHDVVVRFNNFSDDAAYVADYGRKADVWVRAAGHTGVWARAASRFGHVVFSGPDRRHHGLAPWDVVELVRAGGRAAFVPTPIYVDLVRELRHPPSAGLLFLYWLRRLRGPLAAANVSLYGFSGAASGPRRHYFEARPIDDSARRHDWTAEAAFLQRMVGS